MKTKKTNPLLYALAGLGLIAGLGVLLMQTRSIDVAAHNEFLTDLRQLKQVDAEWNVDVLRSKTGLASNYDQVASPLPVIDSLKTRVQQEGATLWGDRTEAGAQLSALLEDYSRLMDRKIDLIERFKSQNSILRNSTRFLPKAATDLAEAVRDSGADPAVKAEVERELNNVLAETMSYSNTPDANLRTRIEQDSARLRQTADGLPPVARDRAETLTAHVGVVLAQQDKGAQILDALGGLATAQALDKLTDAYTHENDKALAAQEVWRRALIGYSVFLLLLLGWAVSRVVHSYRLLNKANADLSKALSKTGQELEETLVQLMQAEKMSSLGQMVAGIAHEINTPLAYVKGTFSMLMEQLVPVRRLATGSDGFARGLRSPERDNARLNQQLRDIEGDVQDLLGNGTLDDMDTLLKDGIHGIDQISEIVLNLKNFSRLDRAKIAGFSVEAGLDSTLLLANNLLKDKVQIVKEYGGVPQILGSPSQINQVFLNIITNAVHALAEREPAGVITLLTALDDAKTVRIEIRDNGSGIAKDVLPKIFDPFFTTKAIGQGSGMGLSISYKIIQEHGGQLLVESEAGVGTVFCILLPIKGAHAAVGAVADDEAGLGEELLMAA